MQAHNTSALRPTRLLRKRSAANNTLLRQHACSNNTPAGKQHVAANTRLLQTKSAGNTTWRQQHVCQQQPPAATNHRLPARHHVCLRQTRLLHTRTSAAHTSANQKSACNNTSA
uniref:Uncharacterized protein n=1 Tax=Knipowitschia caucasica TaxID=637954 RepID=A0AAV2M2M1_KNICA